MLTKYCSLVRLSSTVVVSLLMLSSQWVWADDTEAVVGKACYIPPNILFVIDDSKSMKRIDPGYTRTRLKRLQQAFRKVISRMPNANVGLMGLMRNDKKSNGVEKKNIFIPMSELDAPSPINSKKTHRAYLKRFVNRLTVTDDLVFATPIADTLLEASRLFKGDPQGYGPNGPLSPLPNRDYISPFDAFPDRENKIILITDGFTYDRKIIEGDFNDHGVVCDSLRSHIGTHHAILSAQEI